MGGLVRCSREGGCSAHPRTTCGAEQCSKRLAAQALGGLLVSAISQQGNRMPGMPSPSDAAPLNRPALPRPAPPTHMSSASLAAIITPVASTMVPIR